MLKQLQHKRFITSMNDMQPSLRCYWYACAVRSIVPIGNENDSEYQRPDSIRT